MTLAELCLRLYLYYLFLGGTKEKESSWFQNGSLGVIDSVPERYFNCSFVESSLKLLLFAPILLIKCYLQIKMKIHRDIYNMKFSVRYNFCTFKYFILVCGYYVKFAILLGSFKVAKILLSCAMEKYVIHQDV